MLQYKTYIFDCDGVLLDSNRVKTRAFYEAALPFGVNAAQKLVEYHVRTGGVSRYAKFEYFQREILEQPFDERVHTELLETFAEEANHGLLTCDVTNGLPMLRDATPKSPWLVVSGGDQREVRRILAVRRIDQHFDGGIFGSPSTKEEIIARELSRNNILVPALFFGDSRLDHEVASKFGFDFIFLKGWTEFRAWQGYCSERNITVIDKLADYRGIGYTQRHK